LNTPHNIQNRKVSIDKNGEKSKRTIIFRADGGPKIGMGHFIRTLALAEMLNEDFNCIYATRKPTEYQIVEIENVCHKRIDLPEDDTHFDFFLEQLKGDEIVVLDNYYFNTEYQRIIKAKGCKLVCIDDMHDKHFVADLVINHAPGIVESSFSKENNTKLLLGPKYSLVKKVFREFNSSRIEFTEYPKSLLIVFGGADFYNLTQTYLEEVAELNIFSTINIITGSSYVFLDELYSYLKSFDKNKIRHFHNINSEEIIEVAKDSDMAIAPSSTILFELLTLKKPVVSGYYVDNQEAICKGFNNLNVIIKVGNMNIKSKLKEVLSNITIPDLNRVILNIENVIDNKSGSRILTEFTKL
jgi:UDP-2,4-diacetamido-2,4,6-trideoxy-beta-L-altropyranose hydrolase